MLKKRDRISYIIQPIQLKSTLKTVIYILQETYKQIHIKHIIIVACGGSLKGKQIREEEIINYFMNKSMMKEILRPPTLTVYTEMKSAII